MDGIAAKPRRRLLRDNSTRLVWAVSIAVAAVGVLLAWGLLAPPCPESIEIASGSPEGRYYAVAQQYRQILAENGIDLKVRPTQGSVENARLLRDENSGVELAIMQAGAVPHEDDEVIASLAGIYYEPLWVFYRDEQATWRDLSHLRGRQVAIGPDGSGTRAMALTLLDDNQIAQDDRNGTKLLPLTGSEAADALARGEIDAAFFVISPQAALVKRLLAAPGVKLLSFRRAAAYCRKHRYLTPVTLHEGLLNFDHNLPASDVQLLAPTACLVARRDLHAALTPLLLEAAAQVHQPGGYLSAPGDFPSSHQVDFPLSADARRYFARGPSVFYRYLPFQWAAWADRVKMLLLPLLTLLLPLSKFAPPVYRWSIRSKIYRWYRALREVDQKMKSPEPNWDVAQEIEKLEAVEVELAEVSVPLSYMAEFYNLRTHVAFVLERLRAIAAEQPVTIALSKRRAA